MKRLPETEKPLIVRTDFSNQAAWRVVCAKINEPQEDFCLNVNYLEDKNFANLTKDQILQILPQKQHHTFIILADRTTLLQPEHPLLVIDVAHQIGREFRAIPSMVQSIENNLSIDNMDFEEFAGNVDPDGVFRGFPE